jgi:hypothetical protein
VPDRDRLVASETRETTAKGTPVGKKLGIVLVALGVFLIVLAPLSRFYAYDRLAVVPLDQDTTSISVGPDATIFDVLEGEEVQVDLLSTRNVVGDIEASEEASEEQDQELAVWETFVYTGEEGEEVSDENPPLSATHDLVVFDRHTGEAVDCCGHFISAGTDPETGEEILDYDTPIEGQYYKLPFGAEKTTYEFWDGSIKEATALEYEGTEEIEGVTVYRYQQVIEPTDIGDLPEAASGVFGVEEEGAILDRVYSNTRTLWVEPHTGVIIRGQEEQLTTAQYEGEDIATITDVTIGYDDETISDNAETYGSLATSLKVVKTWLPIGGLVLGLVLLGLGIFLLLRARSAGRREDTRTTNRSSVDLAKR